MTLFQYLEAGLKIENKKMQKIAINGKRNKQKQTNNIPEQLRIYLKYLL